MAHDRNIGLSKFIKVVVELFQLIVGREKPFGLHEVLEGLRVVGFCYDLGKLFLCRFGSSLLY